MSDGVINLALLNFTGSRGSEASDLQDPPEASSAHITSASRSTIWPKRRSASRPMAGGKFFFDLGDERHGNFERKFKDPDGVSFRYFQEWLDRNQRSQRSEVKTV